MNLPYGTAGSGGITRSPVVGEAVNEYMFG